MKKFVRFISIVMILLIVLGGCGTIDSDQNNPGSSVENDDEDSNKRSDNIKTGKDDNNDAGTDDQQEEETDAVTFEAEILETGTSLLVAPAQESNEYKSSDKMMVHLTEVEGIAVDELKIGDMIRITYNGMIAESYPAQISATAIQVIGHNNLIDGYLAIIDDIYQEDPGLNGDITMIAVDTTEWIDITILEKEMILTEINKRYEVEVREGTFDQLSEEGLIDEENLYFPKGILIKISEIKINEDKDVIKYAIEKWRSGLGAIGSDDAKAKFDGAEWNISKGNTWIS